MIFQEVVKTNAFIDQTLYVAECALPWGGVPPC